MRIPEAIELIQSKRRFQFLTFCGLMLSYPIALLPILFELVLNIKRDTFEMMISDPADFDLEDESENE